MIIRFSPPIKIKITMVTALVHKLNVISEKHLVVEDQEKLSKVTLVLQ